MIENKIITLLTDFGYKDAYVGSVKGVILKIYPRVKIVDISHQVPKFQILQGAFILMQAAKYFPSGTIHMAVVDPGVGGNRKPIVIETEHYIFVGPDNGILTLAASNDGIKHVFKIENEKYLLPHPSKTFAGRDIFAPIAAHIAKGAPPSDVGPEVNKFSIVKMPKPKIRDRIISGKVLFVDSFGNLITNIRDSDIKGKIKTGQKILVEIKNSTLKLPFLNAYTNVEKGKALVLIGSSNFLEIGVNQGDASKKFGSISAGTEVTIKI
jgi:S-adenosylmethionine hydrolase